MTKGSGETAGFRFLALATSFGLLGLAALLIPACEDGVAGASGIPGTPGTPGTPGLPGGSGVSENDDGNPDPLSSVVALQVVDFGNTGATNLADFVKARVAQYAANSLPAGYQFPVPALATDTVRSLQGTASNVVVKWLDPLKFSQGVNDPYFGANCDYLAFFGDGWDATAGNAPQWNGSGTSGWLWSNHEYISDLAPANPPAVGVAPKGQPLTLSKHLQARGLLAGGDLTSGAYWDQPKVNTYVAHYKKNVGGSWFRIIRDPATGAWLVDRSAANKRFDATSGTLFTLTGMTLNALDKNDAGANLAAGVIAGTLNNCSGGVSPWGTVFTGEENFQDFYGDLEPWDDRNQFMAGVGFNPGGNLAPVFTPSPIGSFMLSTDPDTGHQRDTQGYVSEVDPLAAANVPYDVGTGDGHRKMGSFGRFRWENVTFAVDTAWKAFDGKKIVMYGGDDRRGGRIFKWVSSANYTAGMTKQQARALLGSGTLYVGHLKGIKNTNGWEMTATNAAPTDVAPGSGDWLALNTGSTDLAPNGAVLGDATKTIGAALTDVNWNGLAGLPTTKDVYLACYTACNKIGVFELNRPEDVEWNPVDRQIYVAFTNFGGRPPALNDNGTVGLVLQNDGNGALGPIGAAETVAHAGFQIIELSPGTATTPTRAMMAPLAGSAFVDGETFTLDDGPNQVVFEFDPATNGVGGGNTVVPILPGDNSAAVAAKIRTAINGVAGGLVVTASTPANRNDTHGRLWTLKEANQVDPAISTTFTFWQVWAGTAGTGDFDAGAPDNIAIDQDGGVWFGTDGNFGINSNRADAYYYLDLDPAHKAGSSGVVNPTFGKAFRFMAVPSDAEATGPAFGADMKTFFSSVQHPGESFYSTWP